MYNDYDSYAPYVEAYQMQLEYEQWIQDEIDQINAELSLVEDYSDEYLSEWLLTE
jgi:hypothetical protein